MRAPSDSVAIPLQTTSEKWSGRPDSNRRPLTPSPVLPVFQRVSTRVPVLGVAGLSTSQQTNGGARITPDPLSNSNQHGNCSVDRPLVIVHHEAHGSSRHNRCVEGDVECLENPHGAQCDGDDAKQSADDTTGDVQHTHAP